MLRHLTKYLNYSTMINVYYTFIYHIFSMDWSSGAMPPTPPCSKFWFFKNSTERVIFKQPPNSSVTSKFQESKIMPIKMLFKYRLILFTYNLLKNDENLKDSLKIDHDFNTRNKSKLLKLPKIKTEKGRRSIFYSGVELVSSHALDILDLPPQAFNGALVARLWDEEMAPAP